MSDNDISSVRRTIASLAQSKNARRYPAALRARLVALVRAHPERGVVSLARALEMAPQTLERIVAERRASVVPAREERRCQVTMQGSLHFVPSQSR